MSVLVGVRTFTWVSLPPVHFFLRALDVAPPPLALLSTARDHTSAVDSGNHNIPFHLGAMLVPLVKMLNSHELKRGSCCRVSVCCVFMGVVAGGDPSNDTSSGRWHGVMHGQTLIIHPPHHSPPCPRRKRLEINPVNWGAYRKHRCDQDRDTDHVQDDASPNHGR
jgi:hypothetical protein